jgi:hypothetical protein
MAMFTESDLPIADQSITKEGKVKCQVSFGNVLITTKKNGSTILDHQKFGTSQGSSELFDTTVDDAHWKITVAIDGAVSSFILTTPD